MEVQQLQVKASIESLVGSSLTLRLLLEIKKEIQNLNNFNQIYEA
jgi:hypothetical protein